MNVHELLQFYADVKRIVVSLFAATVRRRESLGEGLRLLFIYYCEIGQVYRTVLLVFHRASTLFHTFCLHISSASFQKAGTAVYCKEGWKR